MRVPWGVLIPVGVGVGVLAAMSTDGGMGGGGGYTSAIQDRRAFAKLTDKAKPHTSKRSNPPYGLVLHQMGFDRGNKPSKYDKVTAHYKILQDGTLIWSWDDDVRLPAAGGLNSGSWSVEFAGNFPSQPGSTDPARFYRPLPFEYRNKKGELKKHKGFGMDQLTDAQVQSGRFLIDHLIGRGLTHIFGHVQGGPQRQNDPGPDIWYRIGEWGVRERGLDFGGPGFAVHGGKPLPDKWRTWGDSAGGLDVPAVA